MGGLELSDIQGNVAYGYNFPLASYLHFRLLPDGDAHRFLEYLARVVTPGGAAPAGDTAVNVALTWPGLARCGVDSAALDTFPVAFRQGMRKRSEMGVLGDAGESRAEHWEEIDEPVHILVIVHGRQCEALEEKVNDICLHAANWNAPCVLLQNAAALDGTQRRMTYEHFGFVDSISQPVLEGTEEGRDVRGGGVVDREGRWRALAPGEFILGYGDEEEPHPSLPEPWELVRNGSYLVYRKIEQDVGAFRAFLDGLPAWDVGSALTIEDAGDRAIMLRAKLIGRFPDGQPLVTAHGDDAGTRGSAVVPTNDFRYADDPEGHQCPLGSHIRRANPRDELNFGQALVQRHRLLRRGMPYGPAYDEKPEEKRGLVFLAYCASIARQYEFVQSQWINGGEALGLGREPDPILATSRSAKGFIVQGSPPRILCLADSTHPRTPLVTVRWGEYFFQPGLRALHWLVERAALAASS